MQTATVTTDVSDNSATTVHVRVQAENFTLNFDDESVASSWLTHRSCGKLNICIVN